MQSTTQLVDSIANRLQVVVAQMKNLQDENKALHERLDVSKQELEQKSNKIRDLRMKLEAAKTAKSIKAMAKAAPKPKQKLINSSLKLMLV